MKSSVFTIMKKELARFFGDKRMAITTLLLPGLMIYVMYSFMGDAMGDMFNVDEEYTPRICVANMPESIEAMWGMTSFVSSYHEYEAITEDQIEFTKTRVQENAVDLCVVFPADFDETVALYEPSSGKIPPNVEVYYNSVSTESAEAYAVYTAMLDGYESVLANKFDINNVDKEFDLAKEEDEAGTIFAMMMPMLLMTFLYSGCVAVAPESIAGEKERGTIATMLITPVKRSEIAIGKILALAFIALLAGLSSTTGTILSLPKLMGDAADGMSVNVYGVSDYMMLGVVILSTVLVLITLISIISTYAKTVKEAQTYVMPIMIISMFLGLTSMFGNGAAQDWYYYLIPIYNSVQCMTGIFSFDVNTAFVAIAVVSNIVFASAGVFLLTRMFNSEKIIFTK